MNVLGSIYIDYLVNFNTIEDFANFYNLEIQHAEHILDLGRELYTPSSDFSSVDI